MPPKYKPRKRAAETEEYGSDGGFVEDAPKSKRSKTSKASPSKDTKKDDDGNDFWELSDKRRVSVSTFKNMQLINIREFYEKDGSMLPGKKGISLSVEQFSALLEVLPQIEVSLEDKGEVISRPNYDCDRPTSPGALRAVAEDEGEDGVNAEGAVKTEDNQGSSPEVQTASSKVNKSKYNKKNHEATSDEEEQTPA